MKCLQIFLAFTLLVFSMASAANVPSGFRDERVAIGLNHPTAMEIAPDGRIFILEQPGRVRIIKNGSMLSKPFMTLTVNADGERGVLGIAFDPNFSTNRYIYIYYTATSPNIHNRISRFTANGDVVVTGSERILFELDPVNSRNHNGGAMHFGPDRKLYVAVGEDLRGNAGSQSFTNLFGKILRINSDGTIPTDNPFYNSTSGRNRAIWAMGLRNPFSFAFQPGTGRMFINDVGGEVAEEINEGYAGANFGWRHAEGATNCSNYQCPFYTYGHGTGSNLGCAIVGAVFYNPATQQFPTDYRGDYFFND
jgi:glucose/arabinose dehydrogenase